MASSDYNELFSSLPQKALLLKFSDGTIITNDKINFESLELEESLCSDTNLKYGSCESSRFSIRVVNDEISFKDLWVDVYMFIKENDGVLATNDDKKFITDQSQHFKVVEGANGKLGRFKVKSDKPTGDRAYRDLECYDAMQDLINVDVAAWYNGLTFPISLKNFRDSLFQYLDFRQVETTLINDSYSIKGGYTTNSLSSRDVLASICEINGVFGHINRDGRFDYVSLPSSDTVALEWYHRGTGKYEDYETDNITKVISYTADGTVGCEVGVDGNTYTFENNLIVYGDEGSAAQTTALTNLLNQIKDFTYRPFSVRTYGNPLMDLGTNLVVNTHRQTVNSFVMNRFLSGIQSMKDEYYAYGDKVYPEEINRIKTIIERTAGKTASIEANINEMNSEIVLKVDANGNIGIATLKSDGTVSSFEINVDSIKFKANSTLDLSSANLSIYSNKFRVDTAGNVTATALTLNGGSINLNNVFKVTSAGALTATSGNIGGITINSANGLLASSSNGAVAIYPTGMVYVTNSDESKTLTLSSGGLVAGIAGSGSSASIDISGSGIIMNDGGGGMFWLKGPSSGARINFEVSGSGSNARFSNLSVTGTKSRIVETEDYGDRLLYCYETPTPLFGDIGEGVIAEDGKCYIWLDSVFAQTINSNGYQVFLQKYGEGECYVTERTANYFVVEGYSGLAFGWEIKAKQSDYEMNRLDKFVETPSISNDYGEDAIKHIDEVLKEREVA
jgi:hypothetical protein